MSQYGAAYLQWAPFAKDSPEPEDALPIYGDPINLGALKKVTDAPTFSEVTAEGDNITQDSVAEFTGGTVDAEVTEVENAVAAAIYGTAAIGEDGDLVFADSDEPPYGGLAFYVNKVKGTRKFYQGVYYPKVKATPQGTEYTTQAKSGVTLTGGKIRFAWERPKFGKYLYKSKPLNTVAEAKAWVDAKIKKHEDGGVPDENG